MIDKEHELPVVRQVQLLDLSRSSVYYQPQPISESDLQLMRRIDKLHLDYPFAGARMLRDMLRLDKIMVGRKHISTLMKQMGIEALQSGVNVLLEKPAGVYTRQVRELLRVADQRRDLTLAMMFNQRANPLYADLKQAVELSVQSAFYSTGQRCTASSRFIVTAGIHDKFVEAMAERMKSIKVGHALKAGTDIGPVVSQAQLEQDMKYIDIGQSEGARLVSGGGLVTCDTEGYYLAPTLFADSEAAMRISREEIFGPVANVVRVADYEAALVAGIGLSMLGTETFFGLAPSRRAYLLILALAIAGNSWWLLVHPDFSARVALFSLLVFLFYARQVQLVWRHGERHFSSFFFQYYKYILNKIKLLKYFNKPIYARIRTKFA